MYCLKQKPFVTCSLYQGLTKSSTQASTNFKTFVTVCRWILERYSSALCQQFAIEMTRECIEQVLCLAHDIVLDGPYFEGHFLKVAKGTKVINSVIVLEQGRFKSNRLCACSVIVKFA